jgi:hypothetical protein
MTTNRRLLELALKGLEAERERIDGEISDIRRALGASAGRQEQTSANATRRRSRRGRTLSAAYKRKISEGMKRRWAARKAAASKK